MAKVESSETFFTSLFSNRYGSCHRTAAEWPDYWGLVGDALLKQQRLDSMTRLDKEWLWVTGKLPEDIAYPGAELLKPIPFIRALAVAFKIKRF